MEADDEVYAIVDDLQKEVYGEERPFSIASPEESLRTTIAEAGTTEQPALSLDLRRTLQIAFENSRDYRSQKEAVFLAALDLTRQRWNFERQWFFDGGAQSAGTHDVSGNASIFETLGISQALEFGGSVGISLANTLSRSIITSDNWSIGSSLQATFQLPLLSGAGRAIAREPLTQAERSALYAVRDFRRFNRTFVVSVCSQFYRTLELLDRLDNAQANYKTLQTAVLEQNEKLKAGRVSPVEVDQARQDELRAEARVISAQAALESSKDQLKITLGLPTTVKISLLQSDLKDLEALKLTELQLDEAVAITLALANRQDLFVAAGRLEDSKRQVEIAADALQAGLDFSATYTLPTEHNSPLDFETNNSSYSLGLAYDLPIDRLPERNSYRSALITLEQRRRSYSLAADRILLDVRGALRNLEEARQSYRIQLKAQGLAEDRVKSSAMYREAGRATTRDFLESQRALIDAQDATTAALIDYTISRLELARDLGVLKVLVGDSSFDDDLDKYANP